MANNRFDKVFKVGTEDKEALVEFLEKEEEKFLIVQVRVKPDGRKTHIKPLSPAEENAAVEMAKEWYETEYGRMLLRWHKDPLAGGMAPLVPVTEQLYRTGIHREKVFKADNAGNSVYQGKIGTPDFDEDGQPKIYPSNIQRGQNIMVARSAWVGEWL